MTSFKRKPTKKKKEKDPTQIKIILQAFSESSHVLPLKMLCIKLITLTKPFTETALFDCRHIDTVRSSQYPYSLASF